MHKNKVVVVQPPLNVTNHLLPTDFYKWLSEVATSTSGNDFPVGTCMLDKHCFGPIQQLRNICPGCNKLIHAQCESILDVKEGSEVNREKKWFVADSLVWFACDPEVNGTKYTIEGEKDESLLTIPQAAWKIRKTWQLSRQPPLSKMSTLHLEDGKWEWCN